MKKRQTGHAPACGQRASEAGHQYIIADILAAIARNHYGTVIIGRRGFSRARPLPFGSVSRKIVQRVRETTVRGVD